MEPEGQGHEGILKVCFACSKYTYILLHKLLIERHSRNQFLKISSGGILNELKKHFLLIFFSIIAFMVLNIISAIFCLPFLVISVIGFEQNNRGRCAPFGKFAFGLQIIIALFQG